MERSQYSPMLPSSEGPNPLRPYYRPPSIGERAADSTPNFSATGSVSSANKSSTSFGSSARDILSDLNYGELLGESAPSTGESIRSLLNQAMWKYSSIFMAQPFEVAKMILQCRLAGSSSVGAIGNASERLRKSVGGYRGGEYQEVHSLMTDSQHPHETKASQSYRSEDDDDDEPSYFTSAAPQHTYTPPTPSVRSRSGGSQNRSSTLRRPPSSPYRLDLRKSNSLTEVLAQLWQREGAWGVWKGTNVTFLYSILLKTIETWTRSMLSALLNLPDPGLVTTSSGGVGGLDILDSPSPLASLGIAVLASGVAGLILAPLDIVRTRIMLTSLTIHPRSILPSLRHLSIWVCPAPLLLPTLLHSTLPSLISTSTPLLLRANLHVDPLITPTSYSIYTFLSSVADLFLTLPFETVLRRGQLAFAAKVQSANTPSTRPTRRRSRSPSQRHHRTDSGAADDQATPPSTTSTLGTIVEIGPYSGVFGTMWRIAREEGEVYEESGAMTRGAPGSYAHRPVYKTGGRGQGVHGLWRGWRVGMWGLVGVWGAAALGAGSGKGGEF